MHGEDLARKRFHFATKNKGRSCESSQEHKYETSRTWSKIEMMMIKTTLVKQNSTRLKE